jgi:nickel/cobalt exporter
MKRILTALALASVIVGTAQPVAALAHPLGNFTVNRYARLEPRPGGLDIFYVLDLAEIPAFQDMRLLDANGDGAVSEAEAARYAETKAEAVRAGLSLAIDGRPVALQTLAREVSVQPGQAGLSTIRLEVRFSSAIPTSPPVILSEAKNPEGGPVGVTFRDANEPDRIGWREIVAPGGRDVSNELTAYPDDLLSSPLNVREVSFPLSPSFPGSASGPRPAPSTGSGNTSPWDVGRVSNAIASGDLGPGGLVLAMLLAAGLGAAHALSPGHGKTVVGAYLVGSRGTPAHAVLLGLTVTATHTAAVYALGAVTLLASAYVLPERFYPWLSAISGALVLSVGARLLIARIRQARHGHSHHHGHDHDHGHQGAPGLRSLIALGVSGGLLPCPSALVLMLSAIALHQVGLGLVLIAAFSAGLAFVLVSVGMVMVAAGRLLPRFRPLGTRGRLPYMLGYAPALGALVVTIAGAALTAEGIGKLVGLG